MMRLSVWIIVALVAADGIVLLAAGIAHHG